jgi:hypothetical protein
MMFIKTLRKSPDALEDLLKLYVELMWLYADETTKDELSQLSQIGFGSQIDNFSPSDGQHQ